MTIKSDFTAEEWDALREAPQAIALAVMTAGSSGILGSLKEGFASAGSVVSALEGGNELLKAVLDRDELKAAQDTIRNSMGDVKDLKGLHERLGDMAVAKAKTAISILEKKGHANDAESYRHFLQGIGPKVAEAASEGGFLGFGGERVSAGERQMLARLDTALGGH